MSENELLKEETNQREGQEAEPAAAASAPTHAAPPVDGKAPITEDPYDFERCTITLTFTLLPADGDARGRRVVISARNHLDAPIFAGGEWRLADLVGEQAMPKVSVDLARRIVAALPARAQARQAKQAAPTPAEKSPGKAARGKPGPALPNAVPGPAPADPAPDDRPRDTGKEPRGAEKVVQLSMFDVFASDQEVSNDPGNA